MNTQKNHAIREVVSKTYGEIAIDGGTCCCSCGGESTAGDTSQAIGYSSRDVSSVPEGANMGLGCGNPQAIANLKKGETVLDLGSGGGFDCLLAARQVGDSGYVIGVDMTPEMIARAKVNAEKTGVKNVDFRLGEIEQLPVEDSSVDAIISNCVINLSPEKPKVFADSFRVLKSGGRLAISDIVAMAQLPKELKQDMALHSACVTGASPISQLREMLKDAGFTDIRIEAQDASKDILHEWIPGRSIDDYVLSATIEAVKP